MMHGPMSKKDRAAKVWENKFWDAMGCGYSADEAERIANAAAAEYLKYLNSMSKKECA